MDNTQYILYLQDIDKTIVSTNTEHHKQKYNPIMNYKND